ncbi:hypothetical protein [Qipengyuania sp. JC766]|uniref:hypothetical protein n=1 Tax=Qipengyuania sp. JC766 TaxID=3232139 RepID=UPI00345888C0
MDILPIVTVLGPVLLLAALIYAWSRNRSDKRGAEREADLGAKKLREEMAEEPRKDIDL